MNSHIKAVFITGIIVFGAIMIALNVGFFTYKASLDNHDTSRACVESGGEWTVWEDSDSDYPKYECVR